MNLGSDTADPIPLSALQHWAYCPRQCALIHLDQAFDDNLHTLRGKATHARVDQPGVETGRGVRSERALPLWHDGLGLIGAADLDVLRGLEAEATLQNLGALTLVVKPEKRDGFRMDGRTRRLPRDRMNSLLSFLYAMWMNDCRSAVEAARPDPQIGFLHAVRPHRLAWCRWYRRACWPGRRAKAPPAESTTPTAMCRL